MLYHREIYWENWFDDYCENILTLPVIYSNHILDRIKDREPTRFISKSRIKSALNHAKTAKPFEIELINNEIIKIVIRVNYSKNRDICMVFSPKGNKILLVTCWLNEKVDHHLTLSKNKYYNGGVLGK